MIVHILLFVVPGDIWGNVLKDEPSEICRRQKFPQISLGSFWNTLSHIVVIC